MRAWAEFSSSKVSAPKQIGWTRLERRNGLDWLWSSFITAMLWDGVIQRSWNITSLVFRFTRRSQKPSHRRSFVKFRTRNQGRDRDIFIFINRFLSCSLCFLHSLIPRSLFLSADIVLVFQSNINRNEIIVRKVCFDFLSWGIIFLETVRWCDDYRRRKKDTETSSRGNINRLTSHELIP